LFFVGLGIAVEAAASISLPSVIVTARLTMFDGMTVTTDWVVVVTVVPNWVLINMVSAPGLVKIS